MICSNRFVRIFTTILALLFLSFGIPSGAADVPTDYADLFSSLEASLDAYETTLDARLPPTPGPVVYATELLVANGNRGEALLRPGTMDAVRLCLDRFQAMRIGGVTVAIHYPLFDPSFPSRDEYVAFFKAMSEEVHRRGMVLDVENHVIFTDTPFSPIHWDWSGYTVASLAAARRAMAQTILSEVRPDYLNLGTESDTEAKLTGITSLKDPQTYAAFIGSMAQGLDKGTTKIGAGMGAWDDLAQANYLARLSSLDVLTLHVYDLNPQSLQNSILIGEVARNNGKGLILDEAWLYKMRPGEGSDIAANAEIFKRDAYSFWAPLDRQMLRCMAKLAQVDGVEYLSPFWSTYFFAYLDYTPALDASSYEDVSAQVTLAEWQAIQAGTLDDTGDFYATLIAHAPGSLAADFTFSPLAPTDANPVTLTASATGGAPPYGYTWDLCGKGTNGAIVTETLAAGSCAVTLTVTDSTGSAATATKSVEVSRSLVISGARWLSNPGRVKVSGSGFESGCHVEINGAAAPKTAFKGETSVIVKGGGLKVMVPKGVVVQIIVVNPDSTPSPPFQFVR